MYNSHSHKASPYCLPLVICALILVSFIYDSYKSYMASRSEALYTQCTSGVKPFSLNCKLLSLELKVKQ